MKILIDARQNKMYPVGKPGFSGGSELYLRRIAAGLAGKGHTIHVITPDLEVDEQRGEREFWWPPNVYPRRADVVVMMMHATPDPDYEAPVYVLMTSCVDPYLGPDHAWAGSFDAVPVFSETHKRLLCQLRPIDPAKCMITGLGVDLENYTWPIPKVPGRLLYANDPARGLFYVLDVFEHLKKEVPEATLHVSYDFERQFGWRQWEHSLMAEYLWDCKRRLATTPGVTSLGGLDRPAVVREQLECQVHCMPSDPPGLGTQTHGITQMECAAAGCALVLSDVEAFPEVFGEAATILPVIGKYREDLKRRITAEDYALVVAELMQDEEKWAEASRKARALAERNTWEIVVDRWRAMLEQLTEKASV